MAESTRAPGLRQRNRARRYPARVGIEITARAREGEVCPYCRDQLAATTDDLFECPACATRTHAACRREAGKCTTAGCTGPPPGAAAEAARARRVLDGGPRAAPAPTASPRDERLRRALLLIAAALALAGLAGACAGAFAGEARVAAGALVLGLVLAAGLGAAAHAP